MKRIAGVALVLAALGAGLAVWLWRGEAPRAAYRTAPVARGDVVRSISASGTLNPVVTVEVGSQVSGQIAQLGADFNTAVKQGQIIARIDDGTFRAQVLQAEANVAVAQAAVAQQRAAAEKAQADLKNQQAGLGSEQAEIERATAAARLAAQELERTRQLHAAGLTAQAQLDSAISAVDTAQAAVRAAQARERSQRAVIDSLKAQQKVAAAQVQQSQAQLREKEAALNKARIDLEHTVIRAPIDGLVIRRSVDLGQTVAASLSAPTLFTIAQRLEKMNVTAAVDESDIGAVREGQEVAFTVDAYPGQTFAGQVVQVRLSPTVVQNVVTYEVVVSADNPERRLMPGMTATLTILMERRDGVLTVPAAALRFTPKPEDPNRAPDAPAAETGAASTARAAAPGAPRRGLDVAELSARLRLSDAQRQQVESIVAENRARVAQMRGNSGSGSNGSAPDGGDAEARRAAFRNAAQQVRSAIAAVLTPEQRQQWEAQAEERADAAGSRATVWVLDAQGSLSPVDLRTGVSDGTTVEVLSGVLAEGQAVVTGYAALPAASNGGGLLRLRF